MKGRVGSGRMIQFISRVIGISLFIYFIIIFDWGWPFPTLMLVDNPDGDGFNRHREFLRRVFNAAIGIAINFSQTASSYSSNPWPWCCCVGLGNGIRGTPLPNTFAIAVVSPAIVAKPNSGAFNFSDIITTVPEDPASTLRFSCRSQLLVIRVFSLPHVSPPTSTFQVSLFNFISFKHLRFLCCSLLPIPHITSTKHCK